jgi:ABC-type branched-subunit amino acid transport system ATPase component
VLELQGLSRRYGDVVALDDLSFTVREGQMFGFVGPNGAGKTTTMRIVLGCWRRTGARCAGVAGRSTPRPAAASATCPRTTDKRFLRSALGLRGQQRRILVQLSQQAKSPE